MSSAAGAVAGTRQGASVRDRTTPRSTRESRTETTPRRRGETPTGRGRRDWRRTMPKGVYGSRNWTEDDLFVLDEMIHQGLSNRAIASRLGRSAEAVEIKRKRMGLRSRLDATLNGRKVARLLGVKCSKTVTWWLRNGWLEGRYLNRRWLITEEDLLAFLGDPNYWQLWEPERITDAPLREWAVEQRTEQYLPAGEVARRYSVTTKAVYQWVMRGRLRAVRRGNGNWLVPASALVDFVPPFERSKAGMLRNPWGERETQQLVVMRSSGMTFAAIAGRLDRTLESVANRWYRVQEQLEVAA